MARERMSSPTIYERLQFPDIWEKQGLYPAEVREAHEQLLSKLKGRPVLDAEHYRYGAFCHHVKDPRTGAQALRSLIQAAAIDPDRAMGQCALIDLASHPNCTPEVYAEAFEAFARSDTKYFDVASLERAFKEKLPTWRQ
jgi:hypothetical protein